MKYRFYIFDVFTPTPFAGNQLAVLPEAAGINAIGMQNIAREFNFAETSFVFPPTSPENTHKVRIFTPGRELPFAGHPTIGTACALLYSGLAGNGKKADFLFEEGVGNIPVNVTSENGTVTAILSNAEPVETYVPSPSPDIIARVLSLKPDEVSDVFFVSVGAPFCCVQLKSAEAVDRAALDKSVWQSHLAEAWSSSLFLFSGNTESGSELYARMFAPGWGIDEDPATGSAAAALVGALAQRSKVLTGTFDLSITQGVRMGRSSEMQLSAQVQDGAVVSTSVGGPAAFVAEGEIEVSEAFLG
jgi:trans-2,3-dihydro-3-hydroxyanthranilate isomerase